MEEFYSFCTYEIYYKMYLITHVINSLKKIKGFLTKTLDPLAHISKESKDIEQTSFVQRPAV